MTSFLVLQRLYKYLGVQNEIAERPNTINERQSISFASDRPATCKKQKESNDL